MFTTQLITTYPSIKLGLMGGNYVGLQFSVRFVRSVLFHRGRVVSTLHSNMGCWHRLYSISQRHPSPRTRNFNRVLYSYVTSSKNPICMATYNCSLYPPSCLASIIHRQCRKKDILYRAKHTRPDSPTKININSSGTSQERKRKTQLLSIPLR